MNRELPYVLFAKGWMKIPNERYWDCLRIIASNYSGISPNSIVNENILYHTSKIIDKYSPVNMLKYNEELLLTLRLYEKENFTPIQAMIRTNLSIIATFRNDVFPENFMKNQEEHDKIAEEIVSQTLNWK